MHWRRTGLGHREIPRNRADLENRPPHQTFVASCAAIPNYMEAMTMPFLVRDQKLLDGLEPSMQVDFTLVVEEDDSYAENIQRSQLSKSRTGTAPGPPIATSG